MRKISTAALVLSTSMPGCFALFSLDEYGPPPDDTAQRDASLDSTVDAGGRDAADAKPPPDRKLFVTRGTWSGSFGGLDGGDSRCMAAATDAGLTGSYRAWLSDETKSAVGRLASDAGPLRLLTGELVAANVVELAATGPRSAIDVDERGIAVDAGGSCDDGGLVVWTGTYDDGGTAGPRDCQRWRAGGNGSDGVAGLVGGGPQDWSAACLRTCDKPAALYCIEQ